MTKREELEYALIHTISKEQEDQIHDEWRAFWDDPTSFIGDRVLDMVCSDLGLPLPSEKQDEIEGIIKLKITHEQLVGISKEWARFYENPTEIGTPLIADMVMMWVTDTYNQDKKEETGIRGSTANVDMTPTYRRIDDILRNARPSNTYNENKKENVSMSKFVENNKIEWKHESPDGTLSWGKLDGEFVYKRVMDAGKLYKTPHVLVNNMGELSKYGLTDSDTIYVAEHLAGDPQYFTIISMTYGLFLKNQWMLKEYAEDVEACMIIPLIKDESLIPDIGYYVRFLKHMYVSWYISGTGSRIPIMWQSVEDDYNRVPIANDVFKMPLICGTKVPLNSGTTEEFALITADDCTHMMRQYEQHFPSVDLDIDEDKRYEVINLATGAQITYNRNYMARNGNIASAVKLLPLIFEEWYTYVAKFFIGQPIYQDVLRIAIEGTIEKQVLLTTDKNRYDSDVAEPWVAPELPGVTTDEPKPAETKTSESVEAQVGLKGKGYEANILLRAAKASDTKN